MKKIAFLVACISLALCALAQTQQGYVRTIGKPGKKGVALSGVTVRAKGNHNAVVSKSNGRFSMKMKGLKNGGAYSLQQVQKNGYELNDAGTIGRQYAFSSTVPLTIVMISTAQLQADKQRIENNAYAVAEKNYKAKMAKLEKQLNENTITAEEYRAALQELQDSFEKYQSLIESLADHYAHTDYDMLDENEAMINTLIENGELEKADSLIKTLFDPIDVLKRNKETLDRLDQTIADAQGIIDQANEDWAAVLKQQEKDAEYLYQLYTIALAQFDNERAAKYIQTRAELDTTNVQWQIEAGIFTRDYLADYDLALKYFQSGFNQSIEQYGEQSDQAASFFNAIGSIYYNKGAYEKALEYFRKALEIYEKTIDPEHPSTAMVYEHIGTVYLGMADYDKALEYYRNALKIEEKTLGTKHPYTASTFLNIGKVYYLKGDNDKALGYYNNALRIRKETLGTDHPYTASTYNQIGLIYHDKGDYDKALKYYVKSLEIKEKTLGMDHPSTASAYHNIGSVYDNKGDYDKALEYYRKTLEIEERTLGMDHPSTAATYLNIGLVYYEKGDYDNALVYDCKTLEIFERTLGVEHLYTASAYHNIGTVYFKKSDYGKAMKYLQKALDIRERILGVEHPETQKTKKRIEEVKVLMRQ